MSAFTTGGPPDREEFDRLLTELRPKLHRYCARMTGSVIDGEDVVQEALVKALEALARGGPIDNPEGWLFRIAHNAALDHLRRRARQNENFSDEDPDMTADKANEAEDRQIAAASLRTFMRLPVAQRSSVILMDVLGYSLQEVGAVMGSSVPAVKAALHRGRGILREIAQEPEDLPLPVLTDPDRKRLAAYVDRFNAHDFDAIRDMLGDDVRLDLVNRSRLAGRSAVGRYFHNYSSIDDWRLSVALVEGRPAILVCDPAGAPIYFVLLEWRADRLVEIRDFRYARYVMEGATVTRLGE